ncbi:MAG: hypothetical protein JWO80_4775 [Bryobacterales bacterium]|nr:hypothetical protein [Bryobacterales bacterium]
MSETGSPRIRLVQRQRGALLLVLPLIFYFTLPTRDFYWDGVAFAINIEKQLPVASLVHPSHIAYTLCGAWLYDLTKTVGVHTRALFILQAANSVLAELCVILLYISLRLRDVPATLSVPMALAFAFSATWWKFATDANAYVPSIFLLLCAYILLEHPRTTALAGLAQAGAMLFHELAFLFLLVALVRLRRSRRSLSVYAATAMIPVAAAYLAAYIAASDHATITGLFPWITSHSPDSGFSFNPLTNAALSLRGTFRLFFGGRLRDFAGDPISKVALTVLVIATVSFLIWMWRGVRRGAKVTPPPLHLLVWVGVYAAFLFVWMPQNTFYRLFYLPPLIAILGTTLRHAPATRLAVRLFVPILLTWNFVFLVYPQSRPEFNAPLRFALAANKGWAPGTPIVFHRFHPDLWTISYFNQQAVWIGMDQADLDKLDRTLEYAQNERKPLWLEATAYDLIAASPNGRRWLAVHDQPGKLLEFKDEKHEFRFHYVR